MTKLLILLLTLLCGAEAADTEKPPMGTVVPYRVALPPIPTSWLQLESTLNDPKYYSAPDGSYYDCALSIQLVVNMLETIWENNTFNLPAAFYPQLQFLSTTWGTERPWDLWFISGGSGKPPVINHIRYQLIYAFLLAQDQRTRYKESEERTCCGWLF